MMFFQTCRSLVVFPLWRLAGEGKKNAPLDDSAFTGARMYLFSKLSRNTFLDKDFRQLSSVWTRMLWLYLVSSPRNTALPGLMMLSFEEMANDLAWEVDLGEGARIQLEASLRELQAEEWIVYHRGLGMLLAPRLFDANVPANPSVIAHWKRMLLKMPRNVLVDIWARMARRKFRELDGAASDRMGGKAWRLDTLEEFLADIDDCYSPPSVVDYDLITEEDRKYILVPANPTKARVYPPLSTRKRKSKPEPVYVNPVRLAPCPIDDLPQNDLPPVVTDEVELELPPQDVADDVEQVDNLQLLTQAFESGADVVSPEPEPAKGEGKRKRYPKVKPDIRERVSEEVKTLVDYFQHRLRKDKADCKLPEGSALDAWYYYMDLILGRDKRHRSEVSLLITWVTQDDFEKANVRCPRKLRERYDQLVVKMLAAKAKWEREQERLADGSSQNGNGRGYRQRNEEPAYPENFGEIPLRPREGDTDEERAAIAHRREVNMQIQREHERSIRQGAEERAERERIAKEEEQKFYAMALERREVYLKHEAEQKAQEAAAREADMLELASQGMVLEPKTDEQQCRLDMALRRREMRRLRARLVQGGFLDASIPAIENDDTKMWDELEFGMLPLYRARAKEQKATQEAMGIPMENPYATLRQSPAMH